MSLVVNEYRPSVHDLIKSFIAEVDEILDASVPFERRVAKLEKWVYVFAGLFSDVSPEKLGFDARRATPDMVERVTRELLKRVVKYLQARGV